MDGNDDEHGRLPGGARGLDPRRPVEPGLVAEPAQPEGSPSEFRPLRSHGRGVRLCRGIPEARPRGAEAGPHRADDRQPALVAGRLRPLRPALHPHGLAQRRHLPHRRRPRRRRRRPAALRAAEQLARQREPRQGPAPALADQAEVRRQDLLGRPHGPGRQRRPRIHGLQDLRLRRRPRRRLGARGERLLGRRGHLARRHPLLRRPPARQPVRRGADGPHLRQPGRPERQPRPPRLGPRHPRDLRPHGDGRRGDRRAHRRRPHLRQDPRRRRRRPRRPRARGRRPRRAGPRLDLDPRLGLRRRHHRQRPRGHLDLDPDPLEQQLLLEPLRLRVGADQKPRRRPPVEADEQRRRRHDPRRPRQDQAPPAVDADLRHRARAPTRPTRRSPGASSRTPTPSPTPSPAPGSSSPTATWARAPATSARRSRPRR